MGTVPVFSDLDFQGNHDPVNTSAPIGGGGGDAQLSFDTISLGRRLLTVHNNGVAFQYGDTGVEPVLMQSAFVDPDSGWNIVNGQYTFANDGLVLVIGNLQLDWTPGTDRQVGRLAIELDTGGGFNDQTIYENFGGSNHETDGFTVLRVFSVSATDKIRMTYFSDSGSTQDYDPDFDSTYLHIQELTRTTNDKDPRIVLRVSNNNVNFTHPIAASVSDVAMSTAIIDPEAAYSPSTGEYTIQNDGLFLVMAQLRNVDAFAAGESGEVSTEIWVDRGGGFALESFSQDLQGDSSISDSVKAIKVFDLAAGDVIKIRSMVDKTGGTLWDFFGDPESSYFDIIELKKNTSQDSWNQLLLEAHNNGVDITHTATPGYEDIVWSTTNTDLYNRYNAGTGEYTFEQDAFIMVQAQLTGKSGSGVTTKKELAISVDNGGGYQLESRHQNFQGNSVDESVVQASFTKVVFAGNKLKVQLFQDAASIGTYDGTETFSFFQIFDISSGSGRSIIREKLVRPRSYYVSTSGDDDNDGLTQSTPFATIQKGVDVVQNLDLGGFEVTIQLMTGTYALNNVPIVMPSIVGEGSLVIQGDTTTPSNVIIDGDQADLFNWVGGTRGYYKFRGIQFEIPNANSSADAVFEIFTDLVRIELEDVIFGNMNATAICLRIEGGDVRFTGDAEITGSCAYFMLMRNSSRSNLSSMTLTLTGTPNWVAAFARLEAGATLFASNSTLTVAGAATGKRYEVESNGVIWGTAANTTLLPGNAAGTTATGGQYV